MYIRQREPAKIVSKEWKLTIVFLRGLNVVSPDGNGRTGRLIMNLELIKAGFLPINVKFAERTRYYDCFDSYYANNSYDALADLIAGYEIDELENRISILEAANNF